MRLKTLLLSSAVAFAVVGGAQAMDFSAPNTMIEKSYVKISDGVGYWYIPLPANLMALAITDQGYIDDVRRDVSIKALLAATDPIDKVDTGKSLKIENFINFAAFGADKLKELGLTALAVGDDS